MRACVESMPIAALAVRARVLEASQAGTVSGLCALSSRDQSQIRRLPFS